MRIVGDLIKTKNVNDALGILQFTPRKGAFILRKLLDSAIGNARQKKYVDVDTLYVKNILVNEGPTMKRFLPRAMGRATPDPQKNEPRHVGTGRSLKIGG